MNAAFVASKSLDAMMGTRSRCEGFDQQRMQKTWRGGGWQKTAITGYTERCVFPKVGCTLNKTKFKASTSTTFSDTFSMLLRALTPNTRVQYTATIHAHHRRMTSPMVNNMATAASTPPPTPHTEPQPRAGDHHHQQHKRPAAEGNPPPKRSKRNLEGYETVATATAPGDTRLDKCLQEVLPEQFATATAAKKAIRKMQVLVNGQRIQKTEYVVCVCDCVVVQHQHWLSASCFFLMSHCMQGCHVDHPHVTT